MKTIPLITKNFSWHELTHSDTAINAGLENIPSKEEISAMVYLTTRLLQPLRDVYKKPITITSGFHSAEVNRLVGGVPDSQHTKGEAVDCQVEDIEELLEVLLESDLLFDQAIHYRTRNFLHLSLKQYGFNRNQIVWK